MHSHKCPNCKKTWECDYPYCPEPDSTLCALCVFDCIEDELEPEEEDNGSPGEVD
jgi:hypothetical protein